LQCSRNISPGSVFLGFETIEVGVAANYHDRRQPLAFRFVEAYTLLAADVVSRQPSIGEIL
jgi:hypothetical protein